MLTPLLIMLAVISPFISDLRQIKSKYGSTHKYILSASI
jgi:hypothetical protein